MSLDDHIKELTEGEGYIILPQVFNQNSINEARDIILTHSNEGDDKVTHFHGAHEEKISLQRRVWNLLNKGDVFIDMVQQPDIVRIVGKFLGSEFCLGSIAANRILPGGPGQEPHIDYPYWDMYKRASFPHNINSSFPLNCQVTVMLDDFTPENGATSVLPRSQLWVRYPQKEEERMYYDKAVRMTGKAGDVAIFYGLVWHSAMPNNSTKDRTAILIQYLPKFIKPMEDQQRGVRQEIIDRASPLLKQLLGLDYPYPQLLDEAEGGNTEGKSTQNK